MLRGTLFIFASLVCSLPGFASFNFTGDQSSKESRFEQREQYKALLYQIKTNQFSRYQSNKSGLIDYPLYPYLEYQYLIHRLSRQRSKDIQAFVTQYRDTPLAAQLMQNWLYSLGKRGHWQQFLEDYDSNLKLLNTLKLSKENACFHAYSLWKQDQKEAALAKASELWLVPFSQPDECDPIFKSWRDAGGLTAQIAWQRYEAAIKKNEITLGNYLERFLSKEDKPSATKLKRYHTKPRRLASDSKTGADTERNRRILTHGIYRLTRRDAKMAFQTLERLVPQYSFEPEVVQQLYVDIGVRLARNEELLPLLEELPIDLTEHPELIEAQLRAHIKQLNWSNALVYLNLLSDDDKASNRWQYWQGKILRASGNQEDVSQGDAIFQSLATQRSFYGFLAADILGTPYNFEDTPESITHEQVHALEETPGIQRALELFSLDEKTRARREWLFTTKNFSNIELRIAARVAEKWGWHEQAIRSMIQAKAWDDLGPRFPLAYHDDFVRGARTEDIPVTFSLAIARQESAFMVDARSPVGAMGLMQLMPSTARQVAKQRNVTLRNNRELTNPLLNIKLGSAYLGSMFRRFDHNRILASAAYNAGPNRVSRWLDKSLPLDVWIESIPFSETRSYVQNVLVFSAIYSRRLNQNSPLIFEHERQYFSGGLESPNI